jgi:hypothetical protein
MASIGKVISKKGMIFFMAKFMPIKLMNYWLASLLLQIEESHY